RLAVDVERDLDLLRRDVVGELVVVAMIADEGRSQRVELQLAFEVILEQAMQCRGVGAGARAGRCGLRGEPGRSCQAGRERESCQKSMSSQHDPSSFGQEEAGSFGNAR